ncbi:S4 domain-containing protein YaaA [Siminovitchia fortis]|uniref:S4 domain-containing protein YaaA n=2 Tax=Bacillales TaxID=1385 RepID=A0A443IQK2_9BACI|nr:S4 domain-containing protein YaaA [Siminovitchia fortis]RWR08937.1 S4 domain-containing protein YaaA [Siminovitchia fortis]WHY81369.1 S4 domain-containing protein YaaA [Siminovitchia fortis]
METKIKIETDTITLGQFLKLADLIQSGGMAKWFLSEHTVLVNGEQEQRRGRKLAEGDLLEITGVGSFLVVR